MHNIALSADIRTLRLKSPFGTREYMDAQDKRIKDQKTFEIGLSWLECTDKKHENYQIVVDYGVWHVNY